MKGWGRLFERVSVALATRTGWPPDQIAAFPLRRLMRHIHDLTPETSGK